MTWSRDLIDLLSDNELRTRKTAQFVTRLKELHVPRVDGVDKGANQKTFLIRKSEDPMTMKDIVGPEVKIDLGNDTATIEPTDDVQKDKTDKGARSAAVSTLQAASEKLGTLIGLAKGAGDGELPAKVSKGISEIAAMLGKIGAKAEKTEKAGKKKAEDEEEDDKKPPFLKTKKGEDEPTEEVVMKRNDDGSVDLGEDLVIPAGADADLAWATIQKAGRKMSGPRLKKFRQSMTDLIGLWKELDPDDVHKQVTGMFDAVKKRLDVTDGTMEEVLKQLQSINARENADAGAPKPAAVADSQSGSGDPVQKSEKKTASAWPAGVDFGDKRFE